MALTLDKTIDRNSSNTITSTSNYNELNSKAGTLVDNVVSHVEAQVTATEGYVNTVTNTLTTQIGSLVNTSTTSYNTATQNWRDTIMSKAEFNAVAKQESSNNAGSGAINFGKGSATTTLNVNDGIHTSTTIPNTFYLGKVGGTGTSLTDACIASINGSVILAKYLNTTTADATLLLPPAPTVLPSTATLTQQQIDSGVIKHVDASNSGLITGGTGLTGTTFSQVITTVNGKKYTIEYVDNAVRKTLDVTATASTYAVSLSGTDITRVAVFPADAISRSDLVFLKKNVVDVTVNDFYYPLGNRQYLGTTADGLSTVSGAFASAPTYSLFSDVWQADSALIGKGFVWSTLSDANKKTVVANPENNSYLDGDKVYQAQYIAQVAMMKGDYFTESTAFTALGYTVDTVDKGLYKHADGSEAIGICLVHRRNQGFMHPVYNPNGTKLASDSLPWYSTTVSFTSIADCFTDSKLLTTSGYIGTVSGRADGIFYDQVHEGDITDLRNNSAKVQDYNRLIDREFNKLVAGTYRGSQGELNTEVKTQTTTGTVATVEVNDGTKYKSGDTIYIYDMTASAIKGRYTVKSISTNTLTVGVAFAKLANSYMISGGSTTRTKSNTITMTDMIGSPSNLPASMKLEGQSFNTLHTAEDGTSLLPTGTTGSDGLATYKLPRDANATPLQVLKSTDSGATWTALTVTTHYTFSTTTNDITFTAGNIPLATDLVLVTYQTHTNMAVPAVNSEVLDIGDGFATQNYASAIGGILLQSLIGKIGVVPGAAAWKQTNITNWSVNSGLLYPSNEVSHIVPLTLTSSQTPAVKVFPYLTRLNGKAYLNLVFKEMKYNGTSWGDDSKFNIVDNVSTTTDNNAQTVLIGQKRVELPYFIGAAE